MEKSTAHMPIFYGKEDILLPFGRRMSSFFCETPDEKQAAKYKTHFAACLVRVVRLERTVSRSQTNPKNFLD